MNIVIAIDSFKGSLTSLEAGRAAAKGWRRAFPEANITIKPIADGGEGTVDALVEGLGGSYRTVTAANPLGKPMEGRYGMVSDTVVIEIAAVAGLALLKEEDRNPMETTTYGVGELIKDAIASGCRKFLIGIGGSATNDAGVGMLQALGFSFLDESGKSVPFGAKALGNIASIETENVLPELEECEFHIACDVENPLYGEMGCSHIYARQKGASPEQILQMDSAIAHYAKIVAQAFPQADPNLPGSGAAGGLGFAFKTFLNASLTSGIALVLDKIGIDECIKVADLVITGEGRIDSQTVMGKAPIGIAKMAKKYHKPVIAFAGSVSSDAAICNQHGIDAIFSIVPSPCSLSQAMQRENALENMENCAAQVANVLAIKNK
ncbi:MAG: glycerate kinase [Ruminococcaceae bacterium]|nr:glycerate kinase [Oscillospiraceae bacterium]